MKSKEQKQVAYIHHRKDGVVSFKVPGRKVFTTTPGQTVDMRATVNEVKTNLETLGFTVHETRQK